MFKIISVLAAVFWMISVPVSADAAQQKANGIKNRAPYQLRVVQRNHKPRYYYYYNYVPGADGRYYYRPGRYYHQPTYPYDFDYYSPYYYPPGNLWLRQHVPSTRYF